VRLTLRMQDADFFLEHIQKEGQFGNLHTLNSAALSDSQKNIWLNAGLLEDRLKQLKAKTCKRLAQFIVKQCFIVVVSTPDVASAYRTFMVLNNRGLDLAHSDILKSDIIVNVRWTAGRTGAYAACVIGASPFGPPPPGLRFAPVLRTSTSGG